MINLKPVKTKFFNFVLWVLSKNILLVCALLMLEMLTLCVWIPNKVTACLYVVFSFFACFVVTACLFVWSRLFPSILLTSFCSFRSFFKSANFEGWFRNRQYEIQQKLQLLHLEALSVAVCISHLVIFQYGICSFQPDSELNVWEKRTGWPMTSPECAFSYQVIGKRRKDWD